MKRKNGIVSSNTTSTPTTDLDTSQSRKGKKPKLSSDPEPKDVYPAFRNDLFETSPLTEYQNYYAKSEPYKHCVIHNLINDNLLSSVCKEIRQNLHFTPKQTDIYSIHQTGDLANLSGLSHKEAALFPNLLKLRNALYSSTFRQYIEKITNCGPLSGIKTDMAINVYTKGCHLLTHDDVIGSRRVSYILYITEEWKPEWGGALRLYLTKSAVDSDVRIPTADWSVVIPPSWNQLSFFPVQPGYSFHDVEEVTEEGKVRMAISGWFHIPQRGEEGFIKGLEEELAAKSSLQQLQSKSERYDLPQPAVRPYHESTRTSKSDEKGKGKAVHDDEDDEEELTEDDLNFLLEYINPNYLVPDTLEQIKEMFFTDSSVQVADILSAKFSAKLKQQIEDLDSKPLSESAADVPSSLPGWAVSSPPHKARYLYYQPEANTTLNTPSQSDDTLHALVHKLLPSAQFKKFLQLASGVTVTSRDLLARRFRPGMDYTLATGYDEPKPRLEVILGLTPSIGDWDEPDNSDAMITESDTLASSHVANGTNGTNTTAAAPTLSTNGISSTNGKPKVPINKPFESCGGYEMYMSGDDDDHDKTSGKKSDPAIYKSGGGGDNDEDDGVLFTMAAGWNRMSIVYRDTGTLRFVKYVSKSAPGSRWDVGGVWEVEEDDDDDDGEDDDDEGEGEVDGEGSEDDEVLEGMDEDDVDGAIAGFEEELSDIQEDEEEE